MNGHINKLHKTAPNFCTKLMISRYFIVLIILLPNLSYSQSKFDSTKIRREVLAWFKDFPNRTNDSLINYYSFPSLGYKKIRKIKIDELYELTNHPLASVRVFSSEQLAWKQPDLAFKILQNHLSDTIEWFCLPVEDGCASMTFLDYQITLCSRSKLDNKEKAMIAGLKEVRLNSRRQFEILKWENK